MKHSFTFELELEKWNDSTTIMARFFFFGTGRYDCLGMGGNDCVRYDQIQWFREVSEAIPADDKYRGNGIAFMHYAL